MFKSNIVFMFDCKYDHNIYYIGSERSSIMCKNTGLRIFISLIGIVVVTIYLLNTSTDLDTIQSDIDTANSQGQSLSCRLLCPSYPQQTGQLCCISSFNTYSCHQKSQCVSNYISFKENELSGIQANYYAYIIIDVLLGFFMFYNICYNCCKNNRRQREQDIARQRAIMALLFAGRAQAAYQPAAQQGDRSLLTQSFIAQDKTQNCAICLDAFEEQRVVSLNCSHKYHRGCIQAWINRGDASCPVCRAPQ